LRGARTKRSSGVCAFALLQENQAYYRDGYNYVNYNYYRLHDR